MRHYLLIFTLLFGLFSSTLSANPPAPQTDSSLSDFLVGSYQLIGKYPDSDHTYSGKVKIEKVENSLKITRIIGGKLIIAQGKLETATADRIKVLKITFTDSGKLYEATYLIHSDLDNYGRLTGYTYLQNNTTKKPGLEALFRENS